MQNEKENCPPPFEDEEMKEQNDLKINQQKGIMLDELTELKSFELSQEIKEDA